MPPDEPSKPVTKTENSILMGKLFDSINDQLAGFIEQQQVFFVATAPLSASGHVNLSPKGLDSFRILDGKTVAYADLIGSGIETVAHLKENQRIVLMFCAFEGAPKIVRLHGRGNVIEPGHDEFNSLAEHFPEFKAVRSFIRVDCTRISDSCGFGVPRYEFLGQRPQLPKWADDRSDAKLADYIQKKNASSIDGLPGL